MILPDLPPLRFFASIREPLDRYFTEIVKAERPSREVDLWMEAEERLAQMDFLVCRAKRLQDEHWKVMRDQSDAVQRASTPSDKEGVRASPDSRRRMSLASALIFELRLSTEAFYYFAARFIKILNCFTELKRFDAPGVRNVRNHLIEHPRVTQQNWGYSGNTGPALKSTGPRERGEDNVLLDAGLFVNAAELRDLLEFRLRKLLTPD